MLPCLNICGTSGFNTPAALQVTAGTEHPLPVALRCRRWRCCSGDVHGPGYPLSGRLERSCGRLAAQSAKLAV